MTFKTSLRRVWADPLHVAWIVLAIFELAVLFECYDRFVLQSISLPAFIRWAKPNLPYYFMQNINTLLWGAHIDAGGIRISEAISAFSGKLVRGIWTPEHTLVIVSMVLSYVVGPSLLLWGMKARKRWMTEKPATSRPFLILCTLALGGYVTFFSLVFPGKTSIYSWSVWQRMKADTYSNSARDGLQASVSVLAFQAQQLRMMPEAKGGGSWERGPGGITIAILDTVLPRLDRVLWQPGMRAPAKFNLEVESPDSLTIWGVASARGSFAFGGGASFRNIDFTTGHVQVHAGVTPMRVWAGTDN